jgi:hypothetical protein
MVVPLSGLSYKEHDPDMTIIEVVGLKYLRDIKKKTTRNSPCLLEGDGI